MFENWDKLEVTTSHEWWDNLLPLKRVFTELQIVVVLQEKFNIFNWNKEALEINLYFQKKKPLFDIKNVLVYYHLSIGI